ncbi:30623_t:CDS:2, partial [Gigaspora margarita]
FITMQNNEELSTDLLDSYDVLFFSQTQEASLPDEIVENNNYDSNTDIVELTNKNPINTEKTRRIGKACGSFIQLPLAFSDSTITSYGLIRLFFLQTILITILTNTIEYAQLKYASIVGHSWSSLTLVELKIWL